MRDAIHRTRPFRLHSKCVLVGANRALEILQTVVRETQIAPGPAISRLTLCNGFEHLGGACRIVRLKMRESIRESRLVRLTGENARNEEERL